MTEYKSRTQQKKDTSANWTNTNPIILDGEIIIVVTDSGEVRKKIGNGTKTYTQLPFDDEVIRSLISERVLIAQGIEYAGKVLGIDTDGRVTPVSAFTVGTSITWGNLKNQQ